MAKLTREYLEDQIVKCRSAIAFRSPNADMTFAKAKLNAAELKLAALDRADGLQIGGRVMQNLRTHHFNDGPPVITGQVEIGYFVAFEEDRPGVRGRGDTELSAIADLSRAIAAADEDRDNDDRPLTGQNAIDARWDHERKLRNEERA